ncbi:hypothetical protein B0H19DRAFT_1380026 [Mycena capillaripes]|nr:hypothetical protein B0H19DRAFT_1380026 [Mycena capillaripes]
MSISGRYRANYTPKRSIYLPDADEGFYETRAETDSYFGMMRRMHRLEGWAGLYKGIMPSIIATLIAMVALSSFAIFLSMGHRVPPSGRAVISTSSGSSKLEHVLDLIYLLQSSALPWPSSPPSSHPYADYHKPLDTFYPKAALHLFLSPAECAPTLTLLRAADGRRGGLARSIARLVGHPVLHDHLRRGGIGVVSERARVESTKNGWDNTCARGDSLRSS